MKGHQVQTHVSIYDTLFTLGKDTSRAFKNMECYQVQTHVSINTKSFKLKKSRHTSSFTNILIYARNMFKASWFSSK
jgi:hypothetical protein